MKRHCVQQPTAYRFQNSALFVSALSGLVQVATRALQLHPTEPGLWAKAAAWEWERSADAAAARALMQRGLRACPHSPSLWTDYFRLELLFAAKLAARRKVLGLFQPGACPVLPSSCH